MFTDDTAHCGNTNVHSSHIWRAGNHKMVHCPGVGVDSEHPFTAQPTVSPIDQIGTALGSLNDAYVALRREQARIPGDGAEAAYDRLAAVLNGVQAEVERLLGDVFGDPHGDQIKDVLARFDLWLRARSVEL